MKNRTGTISLIAAVLVAVVVVAILGLAAMIFPLAHQGESRSLIIYNTGSKLVRVYGPDLDDPWHICDVPPGGVADVGSVMGPQGTILHLRNEKGDLIATVLVGHDKIRELSFGDDYMVSRIDSDHPEVPTVLTRRNR